MKRVLTFVTAFVSSGSESPNAAPDKGGTRGKCAGSQLGVRGPLLLVAACLSGCVVTSYEAVGIAPHLPPPPALIQPGEPSAKAPTASSSKAGTTSEPTEISARHLLISYSGALRAPPYVTRTREEAQARAEEAAKRVAAGEDFEALIRTYTDEPGGREKVGDLGKFSRSAMVKPFADAAFALKPGEISPLVETPFGFHLIQRTE